MNNGTLTPIQCFVGKVDIRGADECWEWQEGVDSWGYGVFNMDSTSTPAHRWLFQQFYPEPLERSWYICHTCDNPACVNPNHLFLGNNSINQLDSSKKKRHAEARKTHCPKGHPYSGGNLYVSPRGYRLCVTCRRERQGNVRRRGPYRRHTASEEGE